MRFTIGVFTIIISTILMLGRSTKPETKVQTYGVITEYNKNEIVLINYNLLWEHSQLVQSDEFGLYCLIPPNSMEDVISNNNIDSTSWNESSFKIYLDSIGLEKYINLSALSLNDGICISLDKEVLFCYDDTMAL